MSKALGRGVMTGEAEFIREVGSGTEADVVVLGWILALPGPQVL